MKKIFLIFLGGTIFLFSQVSLCRAAPTPTPTPTNCGWANTTGSDRCCEDVSLNMDDIKQEAGDKVPGWAKVAIDALPNFDLKRKMKLDQVLGKCFLGEPDNSTGVCICKLYESPTPIVGLEQACVRYFVKNKGLRDELLRFCFLSATKNTSFCQDRMNRITEPEFKACINCSKGGGILTGLGCIPLNFSNFITNYLFGVLIGLAGLIALLCIIYSAFILQTSGGNPERTKKAQENLTSCILGLLLIIFSVFILRFIGWDILRIPGFGK